MCRTNITTHQGAIVLNSYIDRMVELLSDDMKETRKNLIAERKRGMVRSRMSTLCMFDESNLGFGSGRPDNYDDYCYCYEYTHDLMVVFIMLITRPDDETRGDETPSA